MNGRDYRFGQPLSRATLVVRSALLVFCSPSATMHTHSNLFVKNIPTEINEAVLRSLFQTYGNVLSCRILKSRYRGSNNVGFVKFARLEDAELAIQYMHLATIENVVIEVRFADQDVGERRSSHSHSDYEPEYRSVEISHDQHPCKNLYVKGFPRQWRERDLMDFFTNFGTVVSAKVLSSRESSGRSGAGLVMMASVDEAAIALRHVDGRIPLGGEIPMSIKYADSEVATRGGKTKKLAPSFESRWLFTLSEILFRCVCMKIHTLCSRAAL